MFPLNFVALMWVACVGGVWKIRPQSKLANSVFTLALHERLQAIGSRVKVLVAAPGLSATNLQVQKSFFGLNSRAFPARTAKLPLSCTGNTECVSWVLSYDHSWEFW
jgi:NAD(P)-dependent dehydrogenase (short-subunit alcohol dehydrogenase family)